MTNGENCNDVVLRHAGTLALMHKSCHVFASCSCGQCPPLLSAPKTPERRREHMRRVFLLVSTMKECSNCSAFAVSRLFFLCSCVCVGFAFNTMLMMLAHLINKHASETLPNWSTPCAICRCQQSNCAVTRLARFSNN